MSPATSKWLRRALTADVWLSGALAIWYVFLSLLVLAAIIAALVWVLH